MKILHITLKKKWFDMILSGEKKEEYREIKPYWITRLIQYQIHPENIDKDRAWSDIKINECKLVSKYTHIQFKNGYQKNAPLFIIEMKGIEVGKPKESWSDNMLQDVFIIKLGGIFNIPEL